MSSQDNGFQPLSQIVSGVIETISRTFDEQASAGARGSASSTLSDQGEVAGLGGTAKAAWAGAARFPLPLANQPLFIPTTLHLTIGDWHVTDLPAEYVVHHTPDGAIKLMGVRVVSKSGRTIDINRGGNINLSDGSADASDAYLVSYLAKSIWAVADTQFEDVRARMSARMSADVSGNERVE